MLNENMSVNHRELVVLHKSVGHLATVVRSFSNMMESSVGGVTAALNIFTEMIRGKSALTKKPDSNGEEKWVKQKENGHRRLQERRNQYPYHHAPLDAATCAAPNLLVYHHPPSVTHQVRHKEARAFSVSREIQQKYRRAFVYHNSFKGLHR